MDVSSATVVNCPCGHIFTVTATDRLPVSRFPAMREKVLAAELNVFACPSCKESRPYEKVLSYTDFKRWQWITVCPPGELIRWHRWKTFAEESFRLCILDRAPPLVREWAPRFTTRLVFGLRFLREKLLVWDAGLDDRAIEVLKLELIRDLGYLPTPDKALLFEKLADDKITFSTFVGAELRGYTLPRWRYDRIASDPDLVRQILPEIADSIFVDHRAAFVAGTADEDGFLPPPLPDADYPDEDGTR